MRSIRKKNKVMSVITLEQIIKGEQWIGLGIAGNQAGHLSEAGEDSDFANIKAEENAPKGMFPWYLPGDSVIGQNPLSSDRVRLLDGDPLQPEPEVGLVVEFLYSKKEGVLVEGINVLAFGAFNDCSRRVEAPKISLKKNWGIDSKGLSEALISISDFDTVGGELDSYRLVCYLERDGELIQYGMDTPVSDYCYFNEQLSNWMVDQLNSQKDEGPLENLSELMRGKHINYGVIGIGATCYTEVGNGDERFLKDEDRVVVCVYKGGELPQNEVVRMLKQSSFSKDARLLVLKQNAYRNTP